MEDANNNITTSESAVSTEATVTSSVAEPYKAFATKDDYDKAFQSTSSKAKNELLKELGINSVAEFKEIKANYEASIKEKETLTSTVDNLNKKMTLKDLGVNSDNLEDFMSLAIKRVSDQKDFDTAAKEVAELYPNMLSGNVKKDVKVGVEKKDGSKKDSQYSEDMLKRFPFLKNHNKI